MVPFGAGTGFTLSLPGCILVQIRLEGEKRMKDCLFRAMMVAAVIPAIGAAQQHADCGRRASRPERNLGWFGRSGDASEESG